MYLGAEGESVRYCFVCYLLYVLEKQACLHPRGNHREFRLETVLRSLRGLAASGMLILREGGVS